MGYDLHAKVWQSFSTTPSVLCVFASSFMLSLVGLYVMRVCDDVFMFSFVLF